MKKFHFTESSVTKVSDFLQAYMISKSIKWLTADQCAELLAENKILSNKIGPKPGFHFRQMLRDGRNGLIPRIEGAYQDKPGSVWRIYRIL